jgi:hydrogenase-4 component F
MGLVAFAAAVGTTLAIAALLLHVLAHALGKTAAFLAVGELPLVEGSSRISQLRGLLGRRPVLGGSLALAIAALLGFPPFALFASEVAVARAGFDADLGWQTAAVFSFLFVASGALLYQARRLLLGAPDAGAAPTTRVAPRFTLLAPVTVGLAALAILGVTIGPIDQLLDAAARVVTG